METQQELPIVSALAIRESPLGLDLDDTQCRLLAASASAVCLEGGTLLLEEGHCDDTLYVVSSGSLEVYKGTNGNRKIVLHMLHSGDMAGILGFIDGAKHTANIVAVTQCELIALDRDSLEALLPRDPQLVYQVMRAVIRSAHCILGEMNNEFVEMSNYITAPGNI